MALFLCGVGSLGIPFVAVQRFLEADTIAVGSPTPALPHGGFTEKCASLLTLPEPLGANRGYWVGRGTFHH